MPRKLTGSDGRTITVPDGWRGLQGSDGATWLRFGPELVVYRAPMDEWSKSSRAGADFRAQTVERSQSPRAVAGCRDPMGAWPQSLRERAGSKVRMAVWLLSRQVIGAYTARTAE